jgi:dihydrofolate reductase
MDHPTSRADTIAPGRPTIIYSLAVSLDGFAASSDGGVDWLTPFQKADRAHGMIVGSRTYEPAIGYGVDLFGAMGKPCWVLSSRPLPSTGPLVTITSASPQEVVNEIGSRGLSRVWLMGGPRLATSFRRARLITEYELGVIPVLLGSGVPLFESPAPMHRLQLTPIFAGGNRLTNSQPHQSVLA